MAARRCSTCSTAHKLSPRDGVSRCPVCETVEAAELRDAAARVLDELREAAGRMLDGDEYVSTAEALRLGGNALRSEAKNLRRVAHAARRALDPVRKRRKGRA